MTDEPPLRLVLPSPPVHRDPERHLWWYGRPEERIKSLENELESARADLIGMAPGNLRIVIWNPYAKSDQELSAWLLKAIETVIDYAFKSGIDRANCPLCGEGTSTDWGQTDAGWTMEGLDRHLTGSGRSQPCVVMRAAIKMANDYTRPYRLQADADEDYAKQLRRQTEIVYMIKRDSQPQLLNEDISSYSTAARDPDSMQFAEDRLATLGFTRYQQKNVVSYQSLHGDYVILADPRGAGRIEFYPYRLRLRNQRDKFLHSFHLLDSWKNDLKQKFDARLTQSVS